MEGQGTSPEFVHSLQLVAITRFWDLLTEFCAIGADPERWQRLTSPSHPFLHFDATLDQFVVKKV